MAKRLISVAMILALALSVGVCALAEDEDLNAAKYVRAYSGLNLRSAPDLKDGEIVVAMLFNGKVTVHKQDETGLFAFVTYENLGETYEGWCWNGYLSDKITKRAHKSSKKEPDADYPDDPTAWCVICQRYTLNWDLGKCEVCGWEPSQD